MLDYHLLRHFVFILICIEVRVMNLQLFVFSFDVETSRNNVGYKNDDDNDSWHPNY